MTKLIFVLLYGTMKYSRHTITAAFLVGIVTLGLLIGITTPNLQAVDYATTARGVDVYLVTETTKTSVGAPFTVDILLTNDTTPLNAMQAEIYFDTTLFSVQDFTFGNTLCEERFIIDNLIDNTSGRVQASCGTIQPFTGNATVFGTLTVVPLATGLSQIEFGEQTSVYVHNGLGTEVVRDTYPTTVFVTNGA